VWLAAADGVEEEYKKQYEDTTLRVEEREAARLLASAKNYIKLEKEADAVQVAIEAHASSARCLQKATVIRDWQMLHEHWHTGIGSWEDRVTLTNLSGLNFMLATMSLTH